MIISPIVILVIILIALALIFLGYLIGRRIGEYTTNKEWEDKVTGIRGDAVKRSRSVLSGQLSEQLAPYLPGFNYKPSEARFIGKPIDFLVFTGMDEKDIKEVVFVEVKTGSSKLSTHERKLKEVIQQGKVSWEEYRPH